MPTVPPEDAPPSGPGPPSPILLAAHLSSTTALLLGLLLFYGPGMAESQFHNSSPPPANQCLILTNETIKELCDYNLKNRLLLLRKIHSFLADCEERLNFLLYDLFLIPQLDQNHRPNLNELRTVLAPWALECLVEDERSGRCRGCFERLHDLMLGVRDHYVVFNQTVLRHLSCELDSGVPTIYQQFSSLNSCQECRVRYQHWLLAVGGEVWLVGACSDWCDQAELVCPYVTPLPKFDYAGLPSFRCRDTRMETEEEEECETRECIRFSEVEKRPKRDVPPHCRNRRNRGRTKSSSSTATTTTTPRFGSLLLLLLLFS